MLSNRILANAIRFLSIDAVQKANSGHPGMPMGMADIAEVLWRKYLKHNPKNSKWYNRDRFIISNGHGSMLLYSLLHLSGYNLSIDDIKQFRQLHSKTAGHPEYGFADGIETTTGPLGQGVGNAVGMAISEKILAEKFNQKEFNIVNHFTYAFLGDGCLMEGISHEVCSLAGTLGLGKLILFWDDNSISIDGDVKGWFTENVAMRFNSYNWQVIENVDGHDANQIDAAIAKAQQDVTKPTLICCKTKIGYGSPNKEGTAAAHGSPLRQDEIALTRDALDWSYPPFVIPDEIYKEWDAREKGQVLEHSWDELFDRYNAKYPELAAEFTRRMNNKLPENWDEFMQQYLTELVKDMPKVATRKSSQMALEQICSHVPEMFGGSADLTGSNLTNWSGSRWINNNVEEGNYLSYGVREFGMAAIMNGICLHGGLRPYGGTFLVFSDYARNAIRMSALIGLPVVYVMTHDSIGLGEDGPTHQPIEQVSSLRLIPNLNVWRPADAFESAVAWKISQEEKSTPSLLALSRQGLPALITDVSFLENIKKGGYVLSGSSNSDIVIAATGSEVSLAQKAAVLLADSGIKVQLVSMPCLDIFKQQNDKYQREVLLSGVPVIFIEAGSTDIWYSLLQNRNGAVMGIDRFGESAPAEEIYQEFGLSVDKIVQKAQELFA